MERLSLADAMRRGTVVLEPTVHEYLCFEDGNYTTPIAACALGCAAFADGLFERNYDFDQGDLAQRWPELRTVRKVTCPLCGERQSDLFLAITHLNDTHNWRNNIPDWLDSQVLELPAVVAVEANV